MSENKETNRMSLLLLPLAVVLVAGSAAFFLTGIPSDTTTSGSKTNVTTTQTSTTKPETPATMTPEQMMQMIKNDEIKGAAVTTDSGQAVTVKVDKGYDPNVIEVKKGIPLTITFDRNSTFKCSSKVQFPSLGSYMAVMPDHGKTSFIVQIPAEAGQTIEFTCGMKHIKGKLVTVD